MTSAAVVKQLKLLLFRYVIPKCYAPYNGTCFTSNEFHDCFKHLGIEHVTTPVTHPSVMVKLKSMCVHCTIKNT